MFSPPLPYLTLPCPPYPALCFALSAPCHFALSLLCVFVTGVPRSHQNSRGGEGGSQTGREERRAARKRGREKGQGGREREKLRLRERAREEGMREARRKGGTEGERETEGETGAHLWVAPVSRPQLAGTP